LRIEIRFGEHLILVGLEQQESSRRARMNLVHQQQAAPFVETTMIACVEFDHVMVKKRRIEAKNVYAPTK